MSGTRSAEVRWFRVAVQALAVIAASDGACPSAAIAQDLASHAAFLRRVLAQLVRSGIVEAQEGRAGGYRLARPTADVTLADIYMAVRLAGAASQCASAGACPPGGLTTVLDEIAAETDQAVVETLARHSLASVVGRAEAAPGGIK